MDEEEEEEEEEETEVETEEQPTVVTTEVGTCLFMYVFM